MGPPLSPTLTISHRGPKGLHAEPFALLSVHDCAPSHTTNTIVNFADDTTLLWVPA